MKTVTTLTIQQQVAALLCISEETYALIVEQFGYEYAWHYTRQDEWCVKFLTRTKSYWNWWKAQQLIREEIFLIEMEAYANTNSAVELFELWLDHHSPAHVESYPTTYTLQEAYDLMIEELEEKNK